MKRLLCITANMNAGGAETFLMKIYRTLDRTKYQMDFCVSSNENYYGNEIKDLKGRIYVIPAKSKHPLKSFYCIAKIVKENKYQYVMRVNEHSLSVIDLIAAKFGGAKRLIMRSSNSSSDGKLSRFLHNVFKFLPKYVPDVKIAPSKLAAKYTFGSKNVDNNRVVILNNGLDIKQFSFSEINRDMLRTQLNLENRFVVGHVGRFNEQKNHIFLLQVFQQILKLRNDAVLLMIGEGYLLDSIKQKAKEMRIFDKCIFTGVRSDVNQLLSAMDVFVFPSLYEGMPNTVIEAQVSGLPCIVSDSITKECNVSGLVKFNSLNDSANNWAKEAIEFCNNNRLKTVDIMYNKGYDINDVTQKFTKLIFE